MANAFWVSFFVSMACGLCAVAQSADTTIVSNAALNATGLYEAKIRGQSSLYTGYQYIEREQTGHGHPFFVYEEVQDGSVTYNGEEYLNVGIIYDISSDNIVIEHFYNGDQMVLVKAKVDSFHILSNKFVHLRGPSLPPGLPVEGYYHAMYDGITRVLGRHEKQMEEKIESRDIHVLYTPKSRFYILRNGTYHRVARRGDVIKLLSDRKAEIRSYLKKEKIRLSKKNPSAYAKVAKFYDSISSGK